MLVAALRQRILELAIQGKLVPQFPEDGSAEELYQQIQQEKKKLIAAGKLKKEKTLPPISEDEIPFDIPKSWKWVRFSAVADIARGGSPRPIKKYLTNASDGVNWIKIGDADKGGKYIHTTKEKITREGVSRSREVHSGDFLLTNSMSFGRPYILNTDGCIHDGWLVFSNFHFAYDKDFLYYLLSSSFAYQQFSQKASGSVVKNLNIDKVANASFPLPPIHEQRRIAQKVEMLFAQLDAIEQAQEREAAIQAELNKRILERAIQGKLVPQRPEEGTAEDLYQQIQREKKKLIAAGKLKKEKPLPSISEEEIPFDIPESWKWVRLGELGVFERGAGIKKSEVVKDGLPCVRYGQLYTTYKESFSDAVSYVPEELFAKCKQAKKGDILMALTGENKPDIALAVVYEGENPLAIGGDMTRFTPIHVNSHYLMKVINSTLGIAQKVKTATGDIIVHTSNDKLAALLIPLPPLAEQERIVHKIIDLNANI